MQGLQRLGEGLWEFLVITVLMALSAALILPFFPMTVGLTAFFGQPFGTRRFKDIFTAIGANWKIVLFYTIFQLVIILFPVLNIYFFNTHPERLNAFVLAVSWIALVVGMFYMATAPTVIVKMNVKFRQLLFNGITLLFGGFWRSVLCVGCTAGVAALILYFPYALPLTFYAVPYLTAKLMGENMLRLKAKVLGTTVEELRAAEEKDDYLNEYGEVTREEDAMPEAEPSEEAKDAAQQTENAGAVPEDTPPSEENGGAMPEDAAPPAKEEHNETT